MPDDVSLHDFNIGNNATMHLVERLRGGGDDVRTGTFRSAREDRGDRDRDRDTAKFLIHRKVHGGLHREAETLFSSGDCLSFNCYLFTFYSFINFDVLVKSFQDLFKHSCS